MKAAQRQALVKVDGIDGYWAQKSGGEVTAEANKVFDGGSLRPDVIASPPEVGDITVTRPYDPIRDQEIINVLKTRVGNWSTTISVTPTETDLRAARVRGDTYPQALLIGLRLPEWDASSGDAADYELTFAVGSIG